MRYELIKVRMHDENVFWRRNTQAAACYHCLPDVQYKSKSYNQLDDVSGLPEHAVNLVGYHANSVLSREVIRNKGHC